MDFYEVMKLGMLVQGRNYHDVSDEIKKTKERCDLILECKHQITYWKAKLEVLEDEQATCIKLARLRIDAVSTWRSLSRRERLDKKFILAALEAPEIPSSLKEFASASFPPHIRLDRDILLARVRRPDFGQGRCLLRNSDDDGMDDSETITSAMDRHFFVPPRLRSDKEVILAIIPKYPQVIESMSSDLRDDDEILKELLMKHPGPTLPSSFIQHFSDRLRSSQSLMLDVILPHPYGLPALAYCGHDLRNDKAFVLQAITSIKMHNKCPDHDNQILKYVSPRLRADRDVVEQAVQQSGLNLKYASYQLRRDKDVVLRACRQTGSAFRYCLPSELRDEFLHNRDFLLHVVSAIPNYVIKHCGHCFRSDRDLFMKACIHGLDWDALPVQFIYDTDFIADVVRQAPRRYMDLPEITRELPEVAFAVFEAKNAGDDELLEATERSPQLLSNRDAMWIIATNEGTDIVSETLQFSPTRIRRDKELMLRAINVDRTALEYCTEELQQDQDILMAALPSSLYLISEAYQVENPSVAIIAIEKTDPSDMWITHDDICSLLWSNREVAKAWLFKGGEWLCNDFPEEFERDEELFLIVAHRNWSDFQHASESLKSSKEFLLRALAIDGRIISEVSEEQRYDYDLALAAFANDTRAIQFFSGAKDFEFMVGFAQWTREKIEENDTFENQVVATMSKPTAKNSTCQLGMLNQGPELLKFYKETLSSFLGLPDARRLGTLRAASNNLLAWGL